jgi:hypothetical protein
MSHWEIKRRVDMDFNLILPGALIIGLGAAASHVLSNRRMARLQKHAFAMHIQGMSTMANMCIEIQCVNYGARIEDAKMVFETTMAECGMPIVAVDRPISAAARAYLEGKRAMFLAKEKADVDTKSS